MQNGLLCLCVLALAFAPAPFPKKERPVPDLQRMQGEWVAVSYHQWQGGKLGPARVHGMRAVIAGPRVILSQYSQVTNDGIVTLGHAGTAGQIDFVEAHNRVRGVYQFEGDTLTICWTSRGARPARFDFEGAEPGRELFTLKRMKR
jgi:uncharacterized protein (TIGR03067 family)